MSNMRLGVNIDHTATLRQARGTNYPDPVVAAMAAEYAGCDSVVAHLREDRRHIKERDITLIKKILKIPLNLEMSVNKDIVRFAAQLRPYQATLVPERRQELTTEAGLNIKKNYNKIERAVNQLKDKGIKVSLFIDPQISSVGIAVKMGVEMIEFNTGKYSESKTKTSINKELKRIKNAAVYAKQNNLSVAAGHGLDYKNVRRIAKLKEIEELNIGHSIICRSVFVGITWAVEEMLALINSRQH
ncbi:MAG: pyridoxine 5'-phosphate synthase [Candidatus Omnitrophota bacterium]